MNGVGHACDAQDTLQRQPALAGGTDRERTETILTSVEPGSMPSLAFRRAPLASWISLILQPAFPMTDPIRELGIMNLIVTARLPGTEGTSNGSSLILRTMRPNACGSVKSDARANVVRSSDLGDSVERTRYVENALRVPWNALRHHNAGAALLADLIDVSPALADDDGSILGDDEAPHLDVCRGLA